MHGSPPKRRATNWLVKGGSFAQQQFQPVEAHQRQRTSAHLGLAWITEMDDPHGPRSRADRGGRGHLRKRAPDRSLRAIDAANGKILWTFDPPCAIGTSPWAIPRLPGSNRGRRRFGKGKVYVGKPADGRLVAIDVAKGTQLWFLAGRGPHPQRNLGARRAWPPARCSSATSGSDEQVRGSIAAFDAELGTEFVAISGQYPGNPALGFENKAIEMAAKTWTGKQWWHQGWRFGLGSDPPTMSRRDCCCSARRRAFRGGGEEGQEASGRVRKLFFGAVSSLCTRTSGEYAWHYQTSTPERQNRELPHRARRSDHRWQEAPCGDELPRAQRHLFTCWMLPPGELIGQRPLVKQEWIGPRMDYPRRGCQWRGRL